MLYFFPKLYRTSGCGCHNMRFIKIDNRKNLMATKFLDNACGHKWQRVKNLWKFIWVTKGESFFDSEAMFSPYGHSFWWDAKRFFWKIWLWLTLRMVCTECNGTTEKWKHNQPGPCGLCDLHGWIVRSNHHRLFWLIYNKLPFKPRSR